VVASRMPLEEAIAGGPPARRRNSVLLDGIAVDVCSECEVVASLVADASDGRGGWVLTVNVDILRLLRRDPALRRLVRAATFVVADGMPVVWAGRLQRTPFPERVTGASLVWSLAAAAEGRLSVYLLGGPAGSATSAAEALLDEHPALRIAGAECPPEGFEDDPGALAQVFEAVVAASPDIVFCGLGFPKQERLIVCLRHALPGTWFIGCGAAIAFAAGTVPRAPRWMQESGLEWLDRLRREPRRLFHRYVVDDAPYACALLARSAAGGVLSRAFRTSRPIDSIVSTSATGNAL